MNNAAKTAIGAKAHEAELMKKKIFHDLRSRMEGLIPELRAETCYLAELKSLSQYLTDCIANLAVANEKMQTAGLLAAFEEKD